MSDDLLNLILIVAAIWIGYTLFSKGSVSHEMNPEKIQFPYYEAITRAEKGDYELYNALIKRDSRLPGAKSGD